MSAKFLRRIRGEDLLAFCRSIKSPPFIGTTSSYMAVHYISGLVGRCLKLIAKLKVMPDSNTKIFGFRQITVHY